MTYLIGTIYMILVLPPPAKGNISSIAIHSIHERIKDNNLVS